jgi:hypothetical protein
MWIIYDYLRWKFIKGLNWLLTVCFGFVGASEKINYRPELRAEESYSQNVVVARIRKIFDSKAVVSL